MKLSSCLQELSLLFQNWIVFFLNISTFLVPPSPQVQSLGVILDVTLSLYSHINSVTTLLPSVLIIVTPFSFVFPKNSLTNLSHLIQNSALGFLPKTLPFTTSPTPLALHYTSSFFLSSKPWVPSNLYFYVTFVGVFHPVHFKLLHVKLFIIIWKFMWTHVCSWGSTIF